MMFSKYEWCLVQLLVLASVSKASKLGPRQYQNTTSSSSSPSSTLSADTSTITVPPVWGSTAITTWGTQAIPLNTCNTTNYGGYYPEIIWTPCHVWAGAIAFSYFPEPKANVSYPATYYNTQYDFTMTSPSMYYIFNTITGYNDCGLLGPTFVNAVVSMDPTDVSTMQPYTAETQQVNTLPPRMLTLSDIESGCEGYSATAIATGYVADNKELNTTYNRCNPRLMIPPQLTQLGLPYWQHCGTDNARFGLFDPPGAVPSVSGLFAAASTTTSSYAAASTIASAAPTLAPSTTAQTSTLTTQSSIIPASKSQSSTIVDPTTATTPAVSSTSPAAVIGSATISAAASNSGVVLPDGSTASVGAIATISDNSTPVTISVGSSGIYVVGTSSTYIPLTTASANPTIAVATIASNVISAAPGASSIVVGDQTAYVNGPAVTVSSSIIKLTSTGVVVGDMDTGSFSTYPLSSSAAASQTAIATLPGGTIISASPSASEIVVGGQTITSGGAAITLSNSNAVATLGSSGLVIQYSGGNVATYALPTSAAALRVNGAVLSTAVQVDGIPVSAGNGAGTVIIGGQTLSIGGAAVTLANSDVVTLGPSGLVVQSPGGGVSTVMLPAAITASVTTTAAIASLETAGLSAKNKTSTGSESVNSSVGAASTTAGATTEYTSSGRKFKVENWSMKVCLLLGILCIL